MNAFGITSIVAGIVFLTMGICFISRMKSNNDFHVKLNIICLLLASITVASLALITHVNTEAGIVYILVYAGGLGLGILHTWLLYQVLEWTDVKRFLPESIFTLLIFLLGAVGFILYTQLVAGNNLSVLMATALISFFVPFLIHKAYHMELQVPKKAFKKWKFPEKFKVMNSDMHEHLIISLFAAKSYDADQFSKFTIRAPLHQRLGDVFCYFVNGYNQQQAENGFKHLTTCSEKEIGWIFYTKSPLIGTKKILDPEKTIKENGFREKHVIYIKRALLQT